MPLLDQGLLHQILHLFHGGNLSRVLLLHQGAYPSSDLHGFLKVGTAYRLGRPENRICDLFHVERNLSSIPLDNVN